MKIGDDRRFDIIYPLAIDGYVTVPFDAVYPLQ
jgi:hypothetical protein